MMASERKGEISDQIHWAICKQRELDSMEGKDQTTASENNTRIGLWPTEVLTPPPSSS